MIQDATYAKHMYQNSKHNVGVGCCIKGDEVAETKVKKCGNLIVVASFKELCSFAVLSYVLREN